MRRIAPAIILSVRPYGEQRHRCLITSRKTLASPSTERGNTAPCSQSSCAPVIASLCQKVHPSRRAKKSAGRRSNLALRMSLCWKLLPKRASRLADKIGGVVIVMQQAVAPPQSAPASYVQPAGPSTRPLNIIAPPPRQCVPNPDDEVVVCGRRDQEQFRLRPLPPMPPSGSLLSRPLRIQIAPGVSVGFQQGGGFGVKAEFGPGKKTGEAEPE